jgi:hypothetical protein
MPKFERIHDAFREDGRGFLSHLAARGGSNRTRRRAPVLHTGALVADVLGSTRQSVGDLQSVTSAPEFLTQKSRDCVHAPVRLLRKSIAIARKVPL